MLENLALFQVLGPVLSRKKVSTVKCCSVQKVGFSKEKMGGPDS